MGQIPGYDITVLRNGEDVSHKVVRGSSTLHKDKLSRSWEIELAEPMALITSDTWTIKRRLAGYESVWCQDCVATNLAGQDGIASGGGNVVRLASTRRVSGGAIDAGINDLLTYCVPKTLVFVNEDWITSIFPTAKLADGVLVYGGVGPGGLDASRIYHPRLPGQEYASDSFECILGVQTHHAVARHLAGLVGYRLVTSTPNVEVIDTYTVAAGTTWLSAIESVFKKLWQPTIEICDSTIYVSDILSENAEVAAVQKIGLANDAIESASLNQAAHQRKESPLDHLIVTGRRTNNTQILRPEPPDYTPVEIPEIELASDLDIEVSRTFSDKLKYKQMGEIDQPFGLPGEEIEPKSLKHQIHYMHFHIDESEGRRKYITVGETTKSYDSNDVEVARKVITYKYGKGFVPVRTIEKDYVYTNMPGTADKQLHLVGTKTTVQRHCRRPLNLTLTEEIFEGLVLYETVEVDGGEYKVDPQSLSDILRADTTRSIIETDPDTKQGTLEMTIRERTTTIFRSHDDILIKHESTHDRLTNYTRTNSQILDNPQRDRKKVKTDHMLRKEYFDGPGKSIGGYGPCYHPPKTIHHDDISTEALADKVASRAFARKNIEKNHEWTIKIPFPVPIESIASVVALPEFQARANGQLITVPGGDFVLKQVTESFSFDGHGSQVELNAETTLTVRARY